MRFFPLYLIIFIFVDPSAITAAEMSAIPMPMPSFVGPIKNVTASAGSDVMFTCTVENLNRFVVAWVRVEYRKFLAIGMDMVNHNARIRVSHPDRRTWNLHIRNIRKRDSGPFMCKINTPHMVQQTGFLHVKDIAVVTGPKTNSRNGSFYPPLVDINSTINATALRDEANNNASVHLQRKVAVLINATEPKAGAEIFVEDFHFRKHRPKARAKESLNLLKSVIPLLQSIQMVMSQLLILVSADPTISNDIYIPKERSKMQSQMTEVDVQNQL